MTSRQQTLAWGAVILLFITLLYLLGPILLPFIVGMAIAYLLDPVADKLEELGMARLWATVCILLVFVLLFATFLITLVPVLVQQAADFVESLPSLLRTLEGMLRSGFDQLLVKIPGADAAMLQNSASSILSGSKEIFQQLAKTVISSTSWFLSLLSMLLIAPVVSFYLLRDWDKMMGILDEALPRDHRQTILGLMQEIDEMLSGFLRGQGLVALILGIFYALALTIIGLKFGLLIGLIAGLLSFVPYVGSLTGFLMATGMAFVQFEGQWLMIGVTAGVFIFGQFAEGNFISPKLVGDRVRLHPVWLIFALLTGGYFMGFTGALIAVPVAASIGVLVRFAMRQYYQSKLYHGSESAAKAAQTDETPAQ